MLFFSFGNRAFNKEYSESNIYMIISPKEKYNSKLAFLEAAVDFVNEKVYPREDFKSDYEGMYLKDGEYRNILKKWIDSMNQSIEISFDDILNIQRIKCDSSDPYRDEYLLETQEEYVMFLWSVTA